MNMYIHTYIRANIHTCIRIYTCNTQQAQMQWGISHLWNIHVTRTHAGCIKSGARQQLNKFKLKRDPRRPHDRPLLYSKLRSVTWLVFLWDMTVSYVWHDSFALPACRDKCLLDLRWDCWRGKFGICVPWNLYTRVFVSATLFLFPLEERKRERGREREEIHCNYTRSMDKRNKDKLFYKPLSSLIARLNTYVCIVARLNTYVCIYTYIYIVCIYASICA